MTRACAELGASPTSCVSFIHRCWAEIDLDALRGNVAWLRHRLGPGTSLMTVVKADAYGHGLRQIATLLMQSGTDIFGVANLNEARDIRAVGRGWPILMLGACLPDETERAILRRNQNLKVSLERLVIALTAPPGLEGARTGVVP